MSARPGLPAPPRWALRLLLRGDDRRVAESELEELYELKRARCGDGVAGAWLRRQLLHYALRIPVEGIREALGRARRRGHSSDRSGVLGRDLLGELRHALRGLASSPALAATIVLTVGLGTGASTAIFAAVHAVLIEPLPYAEPDRLVRIYTDRPPHRWPLSVADYLALEQQQTSFTRVAGYTRRAMTLQHGDAAERIEGRVVSWTYLTLLGLTPLHGRDFVAADAVPGAEPVVAVSHGFWTRRLGGDPRAIGAPIRLDGEDHILVAVLPRSPGPLERDSEVFAVARWETPPRRGPFFITALGRLGPGVEPAAAVAELRAINERIFPLWQAGYSDREASWGAIGLDEHVIGDAGAALVVVLACVVFMLLIACTNAASLLVARVSNRRRELAVRSALGASGSRLLLHLLAESALLAGGGALAGLALSAAAVRLLASAGERFIPRAAEIALDGPALAFLGSVSAGGFLLFGLLPALYGTGGHIDETLRSASRSATDGAATRRLRRSLVVAQFAVATPLLVAAGLLIGTLRNLQRVEPGYDARGVLTASALLPQARYPDPAGVLAFWERAESRARALPGVTGLAFSDGRPPNDTAMINDFDLEDDPTPAGGSPPAVPWVAVTPEYFDVLGIALLRGRLFDDRDAAPDAPQVVVVDRAWAERFFHGADAVGRRLRAGGAAEWITVVGVVSAVKYRGLDQSDRGTVYWPLSQRGAAHPVDRLTQRFRYFVVRTSVDPTSLLPALRGVVRELDPAVPLSSTATLEELMADTLEVPRHLSLLVGAFAALALLLSLVGIYGVMAYFVQRHRREIGVRVALGGRPAGVGRLVVSQGMRLVAVGVAVGTAAALGLTRFMSSLLFEVTSTDPGAFTAVAASMLMVALVACLGPARRAASVDPATTLREE